MDNNSGWKILLIDDEEGIRKITGITLLDSGYEVHTAENGKIGVDLCKKILPQIVITDVRMPVMDGIAVLAHLKKTLPDIEVIVATAFGEMDIAIKALQLDASDFITKPISDDALQIALERAKSRYTDRKKIRDYTAFLEEGWEETTKELLETFHFQNSLIQSSMDGIMACDNRETVIIFNTSMEQMSGYSQNYVIRKMTLGQFFEPEEIKRLQNELLSDRYGGKNRLYIETALKAKSGKMIPVQLSAAMLTDEKTENGLVCFFRDLREIRRLEREVEDQAQILHQDKMMSLGRLAASVVHEINNPLAGVLNYARLMIRIMGRGHLTKEHTEKFARYLELIESETDRCSRIISSLLSFSRKSPPAFGNVNVNDLIERCAILSRHKLELSHIRLEQHTSSDLPPIQGDFNQMQQCIINLIFNAIDAMPTGGTLTLSADYDQAGKQMNISVTDTGTGIAEKNLPHIFEPFYTTKDEGYGVGLGLATVYGIIERHNGKIDVKSKVGQGTTFTIRMPA